MDSQGRFQMVDVGSKPISSREATARATVRTRRDVIDAIRNREVPKGDVAALARVAGIMAAKKTSDLIPLCHPLAIDLVDVEIHLHDDRIKIRSRVRTTSRTGVEMEALTAASIAALTIYDMCKSMDKKMSIEFIQLETKSGGQSGDFAREPDGQK